MIFMEAEKLLDSNILDIIFDGRNKNYGAYNLRRNYNRRLEIAMLITFSGILLLAFMPMLFNSGDVSIPKKIFDVIDTRMAVIKTEDPIKTVQPVSEKIKSAGKAISEVPIVVKDNLARPIESKPELIEVGSGELNIQARGIVNTGGNAIDSGANINSVATNPGVEMNYNRFEKAEIEAEFPGGINSWRKYLEKYLNAYTPFENGAPEGTYTVMVSFVVSKIGDISDVKAETNNGYGMEKEALRVIKKGPKWRPASQNGNLVNSIRKQPVTFIVASE